MMICVISQIEYFIKYINLLRSHIRVFVGINMQDDLGKMNQELLLEIVALRKRNVIMEVKGDRT
jgi:hypothetical protein